MHSRIFDAVGRSAIGLVSEGVFGLAILESGTTRARFHSVGKIPDAREELIKVVKCGRRHGEESLSISAEIPSASVLVEVQAVRARLTCCSVTGAKSKVGQLKVGKAVSHTAIISLSCKEGELLQTAAK